MSERRPTINDLFDAWQGLKILQKCTDEWYEAAASGTGWLDADDANMLTAGMIRNLLKDLDIPRDQDADQD